MNDAAGRDVAPFDAIDRRLQRARGQLIEDDSSGAASEARQALVELDLLQAAAPATPGLPGLRLDAHQILGTTALAAGQRGTAVEHLRRAASHAYEAQPDQRALVVACPPLERQLTELWQDVVPSPESHLVRASLRAVRTTVAWLDGIVAHESRELESIASAHRALPSGQFYSAASALVERPLVAGADASSSLERARVAHEADAADVVGRVAATVVYAEQLARSGRFTEAIDVIDGVRGQLVDIDAHHAVPLMFRGSTVVLRGLRSDLGVLIGRAAVDVAVRHRADGGDLADEIEGIARATFGRALSEHDLDDEALIECERAHRLLAERLRVPGAPDELLITGAYAASYLAFLREYSGDRPGSAEALDLAVELVTALAERSPDRPDVLAVVVELAMSTGRRGVTAGSFEGFARAADLLEVAHARDAGDLLIAVELLGVTRFLGLEGHLPGGGGATGEADVASDRRSGVRIGDLLELIEAADPGGLHPAFHRAESVDDEVFLAATGGRQSTFRWRAQDAVKLHDTVVRLAPGTPGAHARRSKAVLRYAGFAAQMRDRKLARRFAAEGVASARAQVELQPEGRVAHENLVGALRAAARIAGATGDAKHERALTVDLHRATTVLAALDPHDPDLVGLLIDSVMERIGLEGRGTMQGVDALSDELVELLERLETMDPLHPRIPRLRFDLHEALALHEASQGRPLEGAHHVAEALRWPHGGMAIRHHHDHHDHGSGPDHDRVERLALLLGGMLDGSLEIPDADRQAFEEVLGGLARSGISVRPGMARTSSEEIGTPPTRDDGIRTVEAAEPDAQSQDPTFPAVVGARTYIKPSNGGYPGLHFGVGLDATEDLLVVGAPGDPSAEHHELVDGDAADRSARRRGAVHVHRRTADGWRHEGYLKPDVPAHGSEFGFAVAVEGDLIAVGSPSAAWSAADESPLASEMVVIGGVWVFERTDERWRFHDLVMPPEEVPTVRLGSAVALRGDYLFVAGIDLDTGEGLVHEYARDGAEWTWRSVLRSPRSGSAAESRLRFGHSIAVDGDVLVIGEPSLSGSAQGEAAYGFEDARGGAAWVFRCGPDGSWSPEAMLVGPRPRLDGHHGLAVAVRGDLVAITAVLHPSFGSEEVSATVRTGALSLYGRSATGWEALATLKPPHPHSQEMGSAVVITRDGGVVVGAPLDAHGEDWSVVPDVLGPHGRRHGAVYIARSTPDGWRFTEIIVAEVAGDGDEFGSRLAVSGPDLVVAAPNDSTSGSGVDAVLHDADARESGAVHVIPMSGDGAAG